MENQPPPPCSSNDSERHQFLLVVKKHGMSLRHGGKFTEDREIVMAAVKQNGLALQFAADAFKNDKEIVFAASTSSNSIMYNGIKYASKELRNDKNFIITILQVNGLLLEKLSDEFKNDEDVVLAAVRNNYFTLEYASYNIRNNREFMFTLIQRSIRFLLDASDELKAELRTDRLFILEAVTINGRALSYTSKKFQNDKEIVTAALKNGGSLRFAHKNLRESKKFIREVFEIKPTMLEDISLKLRNDRYFLYHLDEIIKITSIEGFDEMINADIANNLIKNPDYLLEFAPPVNYKPAKQQ
jgi:hypothetical protein